MVGAGRGRGEKRALVPLILVKLCFRFWRQSRRCTPPAVPVSFFRRATFGGAQKVSLFPPIASGSCPLLGGSRRPRPPLFFLKPRARSPKPPPPPIAAVPAAAAPHCRRSCRRSPPLPPEMPPCCWSPPELPPCLWSPPELPPSAAPPAGTCGLPDACRRPAGRLLDGQPELPLQTPAA